MIACPKCDKSFKNEMALRMHNNRVHSKGFNKKMSVAIKSAKRKYPKRSKLSLEDAVIVLKAKRDGFNEVINLLESL
jgi:uncharacterized C2H2 Zn-finger protein